MNPAWNGESLIEEGPNPGLERVRGDPVGYAANLQDKRTRTSFLIISYNFV